MHGGTLGLSSFASLFPARRAGQSGSSCCTPAGIFARRATRLLLTLALAVSARAAAAGDGELLPSQPASFNGPVYIQGPVYVQQGTGDFGGERLPEVVDEQVGLGWFVSAELLVMRANRRGMDFAIVDPDGDSDVEGRVLSLDNELTYDAGFQVALGATLGPQDQIDFTYTRFAQNAVAGVDEPPGGRIWIPIMPPDQTENYTRVDASYDLELNLFDATYHRTFNLFGGGARVYGGVRIADVRQRFNVLGSIGSGGSNPEDNYQTAVDFVGAGPRIGFGFERGLIGNVSIFGNADGSLLLGRFDTSVFLAENSNVEIDIFQQFSQTVPVADVELGLFWEPGFLRRWRFFFGWQQMNFFNMSPVQQFVEDGSQDQGTFVDLSHDLSLSAFFARIECRR